MASESSPADFVSNSEGDDLKDKGKKEKKKEKRIFGKKKRNRSLMKQLKTTSQQDLKPTPARPISCLGQFTSCHDFRSATENFPDSTSSEALRSSFSARPSSSSSSSSPGHSFEEGSLSSSGENRRLRRINISGNRRVSNSAQSLPSVDDRKDHFESFLKSFNLLEYRESLEKEGYTSEASMFKIQPSNLRDFGMSSNLAKITVENIRAAIPSPHPKMEVDEEERDEREDGREEKKKKKGGEDCVEMIPHQYFPKKCRNCFQPLSTHPKVKKASGAKVEDEPKEKEETRKEKGEEQTETCKEKKGEEQEETCKEKKGEEQEETRKEKGEEQEEMQKKEEIKKSPREREREKERERENQKKKEKEKYQLPKREGNQSSDELSKHTHPKPKESPRSLTRASAFSRSGANIHPPSSPKQKRGTPLSFARTCSHMTGLAKPKKEELNCKVGENEKKGFITLDSSQFEDFYSDLSFDPLDPHPFLHSTIAMIGQSSEEKDEEKYFQERLKCLIDKGGDAFRDGIPYIYERVSNFTSPQEIRKFAIKFQFSHSYKTSVFVNEEMTVREALEDGCRRLKKTVCGTDGDGDMGPFGMGAAVLSPDDVIVRLPGQQVYIGDTSLPLHSFAFIRHNLNRQIPILLQVLPRDSPDVVAPSVYPLLTIPDNELGFEMKEEEVYSIESVTERPFCLRLINAQGFQWDGMEERKLRGGQYSLMLDCSLYHGGVLCSQKRSGFSESGMWMDLINLGIPISRLPRTIRLCLGLFATINSRKKESEGEGTNLPLGWVNFNLFNFNGVLRTGTQTLRLWPGACNPLGTTAQNANRSSISLNIIIPSSKYPIVFPSASFAVGNGGDAPKNVDLDEMDDFPLKKVIKQSPVAQLSPEDKKLTWKFRKYLMKNHPRSLPKVLQAADWSNADHVKEVYSLLESWPVIDPLPALELLDAKFTDPFVRQYAVRCLSKMTDLELEDFMLQLVQTLKHEPHHSSSLCFFLFLRAMLNPQLLGHTLFWYLESELESVEMADRFRMLKKVLLLSFTEKVRNEFLKQAAVVRLLVVIAKQVKEIGQRDKRDELLRSSIKKIDKIGQFTLPMNPRFRADGIIVEESKTMQSATVPLFLTFKNVDPLGEKVRVIFKVGDDLRQDILTLQIIRIMDLLWKEEGADLFVIPYRVVATGSNAGMIEAVPDSRTTADIHRMGGGALGALKEEVVLSYLKDYNSKEKLTLAQRVFTVSCATYCVISYVMGLGDRHNDNIMVQKTGNLFHIDFGFIFGNFLKFGGIERETTPFVLTREMVYVMGTSNGALFKEFCSICFMAYEVIRHHAHLFLSLFSMMLSTGIPHLQKVEDLAYFEDAMRMDSSSSEAAKDFDDLIKKSLKNTRVYLNNMVHILANK